MNHKIAKDYNTNTNDLGIDFQRTGEFEWATVLYEVEADIKRRAYE